MWLATDSKNFCACGLCDCAELMRLRKPEGLPQKQQQLPQPLKEHCHERYTTLISAKTYLAEVPGSMHAVPRSSRLLRSQTAPNCQSTLVVEEFGEKGQWLESKFSSVCDQATRVACNLFSPPEESPSSNVEP